MSSSFPKNETLENLIDGLDRNKSGHTEQITELNLSKIALWGDIASVKPDPIHIKSLMESISLQGLIEPLVVDREYRLIAGRHRLDALHMIFRDQRQRFDQLFPNGKIPVAVLGFDAASEKGLAIAAMIAENQHRRTLGYDEFKRLHKLLRDLGFKLDTPGPTPDGEVRVSKIIIHALNVTDRTYRRYLSQLRKEDRGKKDAKVPPKVSSLLARVQKIVGGMTPSEFKEMKKWLSRYAHVPPLLKDSKENQLERRKMKHKGK